MKVHFINIRHLALSFLGSLITRGISSAIVPLMILRLSCEEVGCYGLYVALISILSVILPLGMRQVYAPEYLKIAVSERRMFITNFLVATLGLSLLDAVIIYLINLKLQLCANTIMVIILITAVCFYSNDIIMQLYALKNNLRLLVYMQTAGALVTGFGACCGLFFSAQPLNYILLSQALGYSCTLGWGIYYAQKYAAWNLVSCKHILNIIKNYALIGIGYIPFILRPVLFTNVSKISMAYCGMTTELGQFAVCDSINSLFQFGIMQPLNQTYFPQAMQALSDMKHRQKTLKLHLAIMWILATIFFVGTIILTYVIVPYLSTSIPCVYQPALKGIFPALCVQIVLMCSAFLGCYITLLHKSYMISGAICCALLLQLIAQRLLFTLCLPLYAILYGLCIGAFIFFIATYGIVLKYHKAIDDDKI